MEKFLNNSDISIFRMFCVAKLGDCLYIKDKKYFQKHLRVRRGGGCVSYPSFAMARTQNIFTEKVMLLYW